MSEPQATEIVDAAAHLSSTPVLLFLVLVLVCGIVIVGMFLKTIENSAQREIERDNAMREVLAKNTEMLGKAAVSLERAARLIEKHSA